MSDRYRHDGPTPLWMRLWFTAGAVLYAVVGVGVLWFGVTLGWLGALLAVPITLTFCAIAQWVARAAWSRDL